MGQAASAHPNGLKSHKGMLTGTSGSLARGVIELPALPPSSCFFLLPDSLRTPPLPPCPSPSARASPYAALFMLRTVWGGGSNTLRLYSLFLPAVQLAAWVAGPSSPSCEERSPTSENPAAPPTQVSLNVSPGLCSQRPHLYWGFLWLVGGVLCQVRE